MYSEEQELAIKTTSHNTLVAAAAGSGKTTTIVGRINYLIKQGIEPDTIYAITFTNMAAQEMLERIDYPIFIGTIHSLANKILQTNGVDTSKTIQDESFDELLEMTKCRHIEMPKITHLLVDELQDIADVEFDFIINTLHAQNLYFVGDSCQCQPAGTKVLLKTGERKNIEDVIVGDKVAGSNIHDSARITSCGKYAKGYEVLETAKHLYFNDYLYTITTEEGFVSSYTSNHKHYIRMKESEYKYVVYLMKNSKNQFRIGKTKLYSETQGQLGIRLRMIQENCTDCWIIDIFKTEKEALLKEIELSFVYGIPQIIFDYNKLQFSEEDIDNIYKKIDSESRASLCLKDYKKNINYPFLSKNDNQHFSRNSSVEIYACNIFKEIMDVITYDDTNLENKRKISSIKDLSIAFIEKPIEVYSLDIDKVHNYVADEILTHNSIYGFKGGNFHHFLSFLEEPTTTVYELTTNYRNPRKILAFANTFLKGMRDVYRVESHTYRKEDGEVYTEPYSMKRIVSLIEDDGNYKDWFVLARKNSEVREVIDALERAKIPCGTFKKAEKTFEELKQEMQENKVKVLTIHSAKGLEADNVIVIGAKKFNSEEKRICYVAATRARERLYWMAENPVKKEYPRGNRAKTGVYDDSTGATITW